MAQLTPNGPTSAGTNTAFVNPGDKFWSLYIEDAEKYDKVRLERWKGDTDGILIFTGLFAATVAALLALTIPQLSPDSSDQTAVILFQVLSVLTNGTENGVLPASAPPGFHFEASASSIWINSLWLVSLSIALICALAATLVQQWVRTYLQETQRRGNPSVRGPIYAALATELENFRLEDAISWIIALLHVAVFIFFVGLLVMILSVNSCVGIVLAIFLAACALGYIVLSLLPIATYRSPYRTPLSNAIRLAADAMMTLFNRDRILLWISDCFIKHRKLVDYIVGQNRLDLWCYQYYHDIRERARIISDYHTHLRAGSVAANVAGWTDDEWTHYHHGALNQLYKSVDQLDEAEDFCDSLTSLLDAVYARNKGRDDLLTHHRSFNLRKIMVFEMKIDVVLQKLIDDVAGNRVLAIQPSGARRVVSVMTLVRALLRGLECQDAVEKWGKELERKVDGIDADVDQAVTLTVDMMPSRILNCSFFSRARHTFSYSVLGGDCSRSSVAFWFFLAAIRTDALVILRSRVESRIVTQRVKRCYLSVLKSGEHSDWAHEMAYLDSFSDPTLSIQQALLNNFLWIYNRVIEIASQPNGLNLLDSMQGTWIPLVEGIFKQARDHFPSSLQLIDESVADLRSILARLGLIQDVSPFPHSEEWTSQLTDEGYIQINVDRRYAPLFTDRMRFSHWLACICHEIKELKECERNKPPGWMKRIQDPYEVDVGDSLWFYWQYELNREPASDQQQTEQSRVSASCNLRQKRTSTPATPDTRRKSWSSMRKVVRSVFRCSSTHEVDWEAPMAP